MRAKPARPPLASNLGCGSLGVRAELLLPPLGLAPLDLRLRLRHVRGQLALLVRQPLLELGQLALALFELVAAYLAVRLERRLTQGELGLPLVELLHAVVDALLHRAQPLLAPVRALPLRLGDCLEILDLGLAPRQLALSLLQPCLPLPEVAAAVGVALGVGDRGLEPVELRLASRQVKLAAVELGRAGDRFARDPALLGELALEALCVVAQLLLLEEELRLALADRLVAGGDARGLLLQVALARAQLALALRELLVARTPLVLALREPALAPVEPGRHRLLVRRQLALLLRQLPLTLLERGPALSQLVCGLLALAIGALELVQPRLGRFPVLGRERLLGRELGLGVRHPRVLGLDRLALVADAPLPLLELDLELGEPGFALVERRGTVRELLLGAHVLVVGLGPHLQLVAQGGLSGVRRLELEPECLEVGVDGRVDDGPVGRPRGQLEAELDVRRARRLARRPITLPPALQLCAQAGAEPLLGLGSLVLRCVGHRGLRLEELREVEERRPEDHEEHGREDEEDGRKQHLDRRLHRLLLG